MYMKIFECNAKLVNSKPKMVLLAALILTILAGIFAMNLSMELNWVSLAPDNSPAVKEYEDIIDNFPSLDSIVVLVESDDYDMLKHATKEVAENISRMDKYVTSVVAGVETEFMLENALMLMDEKEAKMMGYAFYDANLTSVYQLMYLLVDETAIKAYDGTLTDDQIAYSASSIKGIGSLIAQSNHALYEDIDTSGISVALEKMFVGEGILTSPDGKMAMITIQPSFDMMDEVMLIPGVDAIEAKLKSINDKYDDVTIRGTGMHYVARDEIVSVTNDSYVASILSILLILAMLYFAFRTWIAPIFTVTPLLFGIIWAMGITGIAIGRLNMMTVFAVAMLLGLGIDYAIHLYSSYSERRASGEEKNEAITYSICHTGPSIIVGALTTAVAFFALNISTLSLLSELGTVMGIGIITTLAAVFWILPAIIVLKKEKEKNISKISSEYAFIGNIAKGIYKIKYIILAVLLIGAGFMGYKAKQIGFDMNLMNLEPKGLESIAVMDYMVEKYDTSSTSFAIQADSLDEVYTLQTALEKVDGVSEVASVASILPSIEDQKKSLDNIKVIKDQLENKLPKYPVDKSNMELVLFELEDRLMELQQVWITNDLAILNQSDFDTVLREMEKLNAMLKRHETQDELDGLSDAVYASMENIQKKMLSSDQITPSDLPDAYKAQFVSKDESRFLITIYPEFDIWQELGTEKGDQFLSDLTKVDPNITGTPIFMMDLYDAVGDELLMMGLTLMGILLAILLLHFRSIKYALLAFLPLAFTLVYTIGTMSILNIQLNMINFLVILLIIGIGLDDGVHILHHYKEGEKNIKTLFSKIGRAIFLTTVTTVFGFGSLSFSSYRGIAGLGIILAIGVTLALVFTIVVLPIFLKKEKVVNV